MYTRVLCSRCQYRQGNTTGCKWEPLSNNGQKREEFWWIWGLRVKIRWLRGRLERLFPIVVRVRARERFFTL